MESLLGASGQVQVSRGLLPSEAPQVMKGPQDLCGVLRRSKVTQTASYGMLSTCARTWATSPCWAATLPPSLKYIEKTVQGIYTNLASRGWRESLAWDSTIQIHSVDLRVKVIRPLLFSQD